MKKTFYIIWNPMSDLPPRVRFETRQKAEKIAEMMAAKFGEPLYVLRAGSLFERGPVAKTTLRYPEPAPCSKRSKKTSSTASRRC